MELPSPPGRGTIFRAAFLSFTPGPGELLHEHNQYETPWFFAILLTPTHSTVASLHMPPSHPRIELKTQVLRQR